MTRSPLDKLRSGGLVGFVTAPPGFAQVADASPLPRDAMDEPTVTASTMPAPTPVHRGNKRQERASRFTDFVSQATLPTWLEPTEAAFYRAKKPMTRFKKWLIDVPEVFDDLLKEFNQRNSALGGQALQQKEVGALAAQVLFMAFLMPDGVRDVFDLRERIFDRLKHAQGDVGQGR